MTKDTKLIITIVGIVMIFVGLVFLVKKKKQDLNNGDINNTQQELAPVDNIDIEVLESFPVQVQVVATGNLPNGCHDIGQISVGYENNSYDIEIPMTSTNADACTQALVPYERTIPLNTLGLKAGEYLVDVNGVYGNFELMVDNELTFDNEK